MDVQSASAAAGSPRRMWHRARFPRSVIASSDRDCGGSAAATSLSSVPRSAEYAATAPRKSPDLNSALAASRVKGVCDSIFKAGPQTPGTTQPQSEGGLDGRFISRGAVRRPGRVQSWVKLGSAKWLASRSHPPSSRAVFERRPSLVRRLSPPPPALPARMYQTRSVVMQTMPTVGLRPPPRRRAAAPPNGSESSTHLPASPQNCVRPGRQHVQPRGSALSGRVCGEGDRGEAAAAGVRAYPPRLRVSPSLSSSGPSPSACARRLASSSAPRSA